MTMIIRLKTNLGGHRIECEPNWSLKELIQHIILTLRISSDISLSLDLTGIEPLCQQSARLMDLNIKHGTELYLLGRYEKLVIDKSFVDLDGSIVPAGTTIRRVDEPDLVSCQVADEVDANTNEKSSITEDKTSIKHNPNALQTISTHESAIPQDSLSTEAFGAVHNGEASIVDENYKFDETEFEDVVRAPDVSERMTLIDHSHTAHNDAKHSQQDKLRLDKYTKSLRDSGLSEYDVHVHVMQRSDEMMARRMQQELNKDSGSYAGSGFGGVMSFEEFGAGLAYADSTRQKFPNSHRSANSNSKPSSSVANTVTYQANGRVVRKGSEGVESSGNRDSSATSSSKLSTAGLRSLNTTTSRNNTPRSVNPVSSNLDNPCPPSSISSASHASIPRDVTKPRVISSSSRSSNKHAGLNKEAIDLTATPPKPPMESNTSSHHRHRISGSSGSSAKSDSVIQHSKKHVPNTSRRSSAVVAERDNFADDMDELNRALALSLAEMEKKSNTKATDVKTVTNNSNKLLKGSSTISARIGAPSTSNSSFVNSRKAVGSDANRSHRSNNSALHAESKNGISNGAQIQRDEYREIKAYHENQRNVLFERDRNTAAMRNALHGSHSSYDSHVVIPSDVHHETEDALLELALRESLCEVTANNRQAESTRLGRDTLHTNRLDNQHSAVKNDLYRVESDHSMHNYSPKISYDEDDELLARALQESLTDM